jgi:cytosine/adenosine deaminase-related metal-dependent hydrolase
MCQICDVAAAGGTSRASASIAASANQPGPRLAAPTNVEAAHGSAAHPMPEGVGGEGRRTLIKGGTILSMDEDVGNFAKGDVLLEGSKIIEVAGSIHAPNAAVIDASGHVVMPGFIDAHHHQFETALRSFLADGILINDGRPENAFNYYETILLKFSVVYRPQDVFINELFGSVAQIDAGVTGVMDISQIHHSPEHSDAAIAGLRAAGRRAVFGYFEGWGEKAKYPSDAKRIREQHFSSSDQLTRHVSIAAPIEMQMRHGTPPIQKALDLGMEVSLSSDVECTMTADMFTQMRAVVTLQRMLANELALAGKDHPRLLSSWDVLKFATMGGAKGLKIEAKTGSLTAGKEADVVLLDATALNVAPLNHAAGAVVTLMDRSNVSTVICAGKIKKWRGSMVGYDIAKLRAELDASRDYVFAAAGIERDLFRA